MKRIVMSSLCAILLLLPLPVFADSIEDGIAASDRGDYQLAFKLWEPLAMAGDPVAQFLLAELYFAGDGVEKNTETAISWFLKSAEQGDLDAQRTLGFIYLKGDGAEKNETLAAQWFLRAAAAGDDVSQNALGWMLAYGEGAEQDTAAGIEWLQKAASQGNVTAFQNLGGVYFRGIGVEKNPTEAATWYRHGAEQGDMACQLFLGWMYLYGWGIEQNAVEAVSWLGKAGEQGSTDALYTLGEVYSSGEGIDKNETLAASYYQKAAEKGHADAQLRYGYVRLNGIGVEKNLEEAVAWLQKALANGNGQSGVLLGWMAQIGLGLQQDSAAALAWYQKGAEAGVDEATSFINIIKNKIAVREKSPKSPKLFGVSLAGAQRAEMRLALSRAGMKPVREDGRYFADLYDVSSLFKHSDQLQAYYALDADVGGNSETDFLAKVIYRFPSENDIGQVHEIEKMISAKYGKADVKNIADDLRDVSFTWKRDGVDIIVERSWPNTTTYLVYVINDYVAAFEQELEESRKTN